MTFKLLVKEKKFQDLIDSMIKKKFNNLKTDKDNYKNN